MWRYAKETAALTGVSLGSAASGYCVYRAGKAAVSTFFPEPKKSTGAPPPNPKYTTTFGTLG